MDLPQIAQIIRSKLPEAIAEEKPEFLVIDRAAFLNVAKLLRGDELAFLLLHSVSGVDLRGNGIPLTSTPDFKGNPGNLQVVYHMYSFKHRIMLEVKVNMPVEDPTVESVSGLWKSANWLERETYDLYGIKFLNHPDLRRILNPEEWTDWPLRKDFDRPDFFRLPEVKGLKG